jgi:hypothetical protein
VTCALLLLQLLPPSLQPLLQDLMLLCTVH